MTWESFYQNKITQRARSRARCKWCGRMGSTQSHHLFRRRPDDPRLQEDWNIVQLCIYCHDPEDRAMQVGLALQKLYQYGPDFLEWAILNTAVGKVSPGLPSHYLDALDLYNNGDQANDQLD